MASGSASVGVGVCFLLNAASFAAAATSPRTGLAVGGASCFVAALGGIALARRSRPSPPPQVTQHEQPSPASPGTALPAEAHVW